jgi:putative peptidoglycan lipid II flippase
MSLVKAVGTIGGLTLVSRLFGFARDMLLSRLLGAGSGADAFFVALKLPNIFRRLFAEGAFSAAFVPMFSKELHKPAAAGGGMTAAARFSRDVLSVFLPVLFLVAALFEIFMPGVVWLLASAYQEVPGKFELTVELTRITFPYLLLISLVSLLAGVLNSMSRFAAAAAAPILLNLCLIATVLWFGSTTGSTIETARALAVAVTIAGMLQFLWLLWAARRAGLELRLGRPRLTPDVRRLGRIILPATFGAGIYQLSQIVDTFFATRLDEGAMSFLNYADRLNQLPLGVIGIALGTAILPALSRLIGQDDQAGARQLMGTALELAMLLTIPAAVALAVASDALVTAIFLGGRFTAADAATTANVMAALVVGLPAYVLIKVFTPGFFARGDTKTPVKTAAAALALNIVLILLLIDRLGVVALPLSAAGAAWFNCALLYALLHRRSYFALERAIILRVARQALAAAAMAVMLWWLTTLLDGWFSASVASRVAGVVLLVGAGGLVYFGVLWAIGGFHVAHLAKLRRGAGTA